METRAFSQYVLPEEDLELKVSSFFSKIKEPVLANPTIKFTGDTSGVPLEVNGVRKSVVAPETGASSHRTDSAYQNV